MHKITLEHLEERMQSAKVTLAVHLPEKKLIWRPQMKRFIVVKDGKEAYNGTYFTEAIRIYNE